MWRRSGAALTVFLALLLTGMGSGTGLAASWTSSAPGSQPGENASTVRQLESLPNGGTWVPYRLDTPEVYTTLAAPQLVAPRRLACPAGTANYPAPNQSYSCVSVYADNGNAGHLVGIRRGGPNSFGLQKAMVKHGLTERTLAYVIVNNAHGTFQQSTGRYLYGLRYEVNGVGIVAVEVYEQRKPSAVFDDGYALGVVTAFCPGYQGKCPPGVNESIG